MKSNKEKTLKLLLSAFIIIAALLIIILVILVPDEKSSDKKNLDYNYLTEDKTDTEKNSIHTTESENKITHLPEYTAVKKSISEDKTEKKKIAIQNNRTALTTPVIHST